MVPKRPLLAIYTEDDVEEFAPDHDPEEIYREDDPDDSDYEVVFQVVRRKKSHRVLSIQHNVADRYASPSTKRRILSHGEISTVSNTLDSLEPCSPSWECVSSTVSLGSPMNLADTASPVPSITARHVQSPSNSTSSPSYATAYMKSTLPEPPRRTPRKSYTLPPPLSDISQAEEEISDVPDFAGREFVSKEEDLELATTLNEDSDESSELDKAFENEPEATRKRASEFGTERKSGDLKPLKLQPTNAIDESLEPLSNIYDIFLDLTAKALQQGFKEFALNCEQKLRVMTLCSGTEAPILALQMIQKALGELGESTFQFEHCASAEKEPFKQAYIERNFHPPVLYRNVEDLIGEEAATSGAITAYGAKVRIPENIDLIIAGTSCKDFSNLNNYKKKLAEEGESGITFKALLAVAAHIRPRIVIQENVIGAQWEDMRASWDRIGYKTAYVKSDTKNYYLPHTRNRGYMVCLDRKSYGKGVKEATEKWCSLMKVFERKASAPVTSFLLPNDDPRVQLHKEMIARQSRDDVVSDTKSWTKCEGRHVRYRAHYELGNGHYFTDWDQNGTCRVPEYADLPWHNKQTERVKDLIDISHTRNWVNERGAYDSEYKQRIWQLSQNVDRDADDHAFGIAPCITPSGIPYLTDRGGCLIGYETLVLQGIPLDRITFSTESNRQIQDLAGNAMSTTVVGSAIIAALIVGMRMLRGCAKQSQGQSSLNRGQSLYGLPILEEENLEQTSLSLTTHSDLNVHDILAEARNSSRFCFCEGQAGTAKAALRVCTECSHTSCVSCGRKPTHFYAPLTLPTSRTSPQEFERRWRSMLPLRIKFKEFAILEELKTVWAHSKGGPVLENYLKAVVIAFGQEFHLRRFNRSDSWTIIYDSPQAKLELLLKNRLEWRLYVKPSHDAAGRTVDILRSSLNDPVARAVVHDKLLEAPWQLRIQLQQRSKMKIGPTGESISSWRSQLLRFKDEQVPRRLSIKLSSSAAANLRDLCGDYILLPECGTACRSLYKRTTGPEEQPIYFFLDPTSTGSPLDDNFVFSHDHRRLTSDEKRDILARIDPAWRPWQVKQASTVDATVEGLWSRSMMSSLKLVELETTAIISKLPEASTRNPWSIAGDCSSSSAVFTCQFPCLAGDGDKLRGNGYLGSNSKFLSECSWLIMPTGNIPHLSSWRSIPNISLGHCQKCAPIKPTIRWMLQNKASKNKAKNCSLVSYEDYLEASTYERCLKHRPPIFIVETTVQSGNIGKVRIAINLHSLAHRARGHLSSVNHDVSISWNLDTYYVPSPSVDFTSFALRDNCDDTEYAQPLDMLLPLWSRQRRSLTWMKNQESPVEPNFRLQEIEEEILFEIHWKVEAKATQPIYVRGGVLADEVAYGKTVTTLALIHAEFEEHAAEAIIDNNRLHSTLYCGLIDLAATIIICQGQLTEQWHKELHKFLGIKYYNKTHVLVIKTIADYRKLSIKDFLGAKVIIIDWKLLIHEGYISIRSHVAAVPEPMSKPTQTSIRAFSVWFDYALGQLPHAIQRLKALGPNDFEHELKTQYAENIKKTDFREFIPSKQLGKGSHLAPVSLKGETHAKGKAKDHIGATEGTCKDWTKFIAPPFHLFRYNRMVVDEFSFLAGENIPIYGAITRLEAHKRWVLSATPTLDDFADVKKVASFLGINLGIDNDTPGVISARNSKKLQIELTASEKFQSYCVSKSSAWHLHRHKHAQSFLDIFVRQNPADLAYIESHEYLKPVVLRAGHRVVYSELSTRLISKDMEAVRLSNKYHSDRPTRVNESLKLSRTPENALVQCCSYIGNQGPLSCDTLLTIRHKEYKGLLMDLTEQIANAEALLKVCGSEDKHYTQWKARVLDDEMTRHDTNALTTLRGLLRDGAALAAGHPSYDKTQGVKKSVKQLRNLTAQMQSMLEEFIERTRALRFVRSLQELMKPSKPSGDPIRTCDRPRCSCTETATLSVLTICGHVTCDRCLDSLKEEDRCVSPGCMVKVKSFHAVKVKDLSQEEKTPKATHGAKLDDLVALLNGTPLEDQGLVFVQDIQMMGAVRAALSGQGISFHAVTSTSSDKVEDFKENKDPKTRKKVLILNLSEESAAGLNLTNANHVIFLSPLLAENQHGYEAAMKQAMGRAIRTGQEKIVHIHHFIGLKTVDVDILQQRHKRSDALRAFSYYKRAISHSTKRKASKQSPLETTKLIRDVEGGYALVPISWLSDPKKAGIGGVRVGESEDFSTLIRFSDIYAGMTSE